MDRMTFLRFFETYGDDLLRGWLRAREDGSDENFKDWVIGEFDYYNDPPYLDENGDITDDEENGTPEVYEVPYLGGMLDGESEAEKFIGLK